MWKKTLLLILLHTLSILSPLAAETTSTPTETKPAQTKESPSNYWDEDVDDTKVKSSFSDEFLHMMMSLGFIIVIMLLAGWALKRLMGQRVQQANNNSDIKVIERRPLSAKSAVYLLDIHGRTIIVGESATGLHSLGDFPTPGDNQTSFSEIYEEKGKTPPPK